MITIQLDKERHFEYSMASVREFKKLTGKNILSDKDLRDIGENRDPDEITALIFVGLTHEDSGLTIEQLFPLLKFEVLADALEKAFQAIAAIKKGKTDPLSNAGPSAS